MLGPRLLTCLWALLLSQSFVEAGIPRVRRSPNKDVPTGPLGMALDEEVNTATNGQIVVFSSHLTFPSAIPEGHDADLQLWSIAQDAQSEVKKLIGPLSISQRKKPFVVTLLTVGKEIFLASSMTGGGDKGRHAVFDPERTKGSDILKECMSIYDPNRDLSLEPDTSHANNGACGEVLAAELFFIKHGDHGDLSGARVLAVDTNNVPAPPCSAKVRVLD